jgi:hypothetical protein
MRVALCGVTGSGKTYSALQLAFGLGTKIGMIDTEHGSGDLYADLGDYDVITLEPPYTVAKYRDAIRAFEEAGYDTIIVDSLSHAWSGEGGLLDKQGQLENSGKYRNSFATWREITPEHNKLVEQMLGSPAHVIATMRSKMEYVVERDDRGKNSVRKIGLSPVQRDGVSYEFTLVMDIAENHYAVASKDRTSLFDGWSDRIGSQTGRMLRAWLDTGEEAPSAPKPERRPTVAEWLDALQAELAAAQDADAVEAIATRSDVQKALSAFRNGALSRLQDMLDAAREGAAEDAIWPPDAPAAAKLLPDERVAWPGPAPEKEAA